MNKRKQTLDALAAHLPPQYFDALLTMSTPLLKAIETFFVEGGNMKEVKDMFKPEVKKTETLVVEKAVPEGEEVVAEEKMEEGIKEEPNQVVITTIEVIPLRSKKRMSIGKFLERFDEKQ